MLIILRFGNRLANLVLIFVIVVSVMFQKIHCSEIHKAGPFHNNISIMEVSKAVKNATRGKACG